MRPLLDFLRKWEGQRTGNGLPNSLLVHCSQGQYRSSATALTAHSLYSGDPVESATEPVINSPPGGGRVSANWEISRNMDDLVGWGGVLLSVAKNIPAALDRRDEMLRHGEEDHEVIRSRISAVLRVPIPVPDSGDTSLHAATVGTGPRAVAALLAADSSTDRTGNHWQVPLHRAAISGIPEVVELLVAGREFMLNEAPACVNTVSNRSFARPGRTPTGSRQWQVG